MKQFLERIIADFLDHHWDGHSPLLLAFSGGPDSLALLHLLLNYRLKRSFPLALAHVDHGWRKESGNEAQEIARMAEKLGLPLHQAILHPEEMEGNLEASCREARLGFFSELCKKHHYQAVLIAHHANDFAETVLKRVFEGSSLPYLCGLRPVTEVYEVTLWRPLLSITKQTLLNWLAERSLKGFDDHTNRDPQYLRARFRTHILPQLSAVFGKEVSPGLCRIGMEAAELREYLDIKLAPYLGKMVHSKLGKFLDLSRDCPEAQLEVKYLIRKLCETEEFALARECVEIAAELVQEGMADRQVEMGKHHLYIDRKRLFLLSLELPTLPEKSFPLLEGSYRYGSWTIRVERLGEAVNPSCSNWRSLWQNEGEVVLPEGEYQLGVPELNMAYPRSSPLGKWWTSHKIPAFLRLRVPVIYKKDEIIHEFLTGKLKPKVLEKGKQAIRISISA